MADIELVIKIPQFIYKQILKGHVGKMTIAHIFKNATPLPKGHGRLIDANALDIDNLDRAYDGNFELDFGRLYTKDVIDMIANAKPIIEADKENKESRQIIKSCKNCGYPYKLAGKCYSCNDYSQWIPIEVDKER